MTFLGLIGIALGGALLGYGVNLYERSRLKKTIFELQYDYFDKEIKHAALFYDYHSVKDELEELKLSTKKPLRSVKKVVK